MARKHDLRALADTFLGPADDVADQATPTPTTPDKAARKAPAVAVGDDDAGRLVQVAAYVTPAEAEAFAALAKAEDRAVSYVLRRLIRQALGMG